MNETSLETKVLDPVCGMWIDPSKAAAKSVYEGKTIHFCNPGCKTRFDADPEKYVKPAESTSSMKESGHGQAHEEPSAKEAKVLDPVCGMWIDPSKAAAKSVYEGKTIHFCNPGCKTKFDADPEKYVKPAESTSSVTGSGHGHAHEEPSAKEVKVLDPVCGMGIDPSKAAAKSVYEGKTIYFCSAGCKTKFDADPEKYMKPAATHAAAHEHPLGEASSPAAEYVCPMDPEVVAQQPSACPKCGMALEPKTPTLATKTEWTCPMHPEIVRDEPGSCPICGMALEPRTVTAEEAESPELVDMRRRFFVSAALTLPLLFIAMSEMIPGTFFANLHGWHFRPWLELILATPVVLWGGAPFFVRAWQSIVFRSLNMFTLIGLGVAVGYGYSLFATFFPNLFPPSFHDANGAVAVYFEASAVIITLVLLGQVMELRARGRTGAAIRALLG
ncbi:MAG: YHS domain-containing protein, partial [Thermoanaerobaculia bacterium]